MTLARRARSGLVTVGVMAAVMWTLLIADVLLAFGLTRRLAIEPRTLEGLDGIIFAPLLHAGPGHLVSNIVPLLVLGFLTFLEGARRFAVAAGLSWVVSGVGVWVLGAGPTIGASGVVFGLFSYLLLRGFYNRNWRQVLLAVLLFLMYGSILFGLFPVPGSNISWQAHLFGAIGGVIAAIKLRRRPAPVGRDRRRR